MRRRFLPSSCFLAFVAAAACTASRASSPPPPPVENPRQVVAHVAGSNITLEDVDHRAGGKLQRLRDEEYQARHQALEEIIAERLVEKEAASRGLTTEALLKAEVEAKVPLPTPAEVKGIYEQNRASAGGRSLEQVAPLIERSLRQQRLAERAGQFRDELKARAAVKVSLEAPRTPLEIPADAPVLGPAGAPVTIVEYLDYQCPFCHRVQGVVDDVMSRYPGRVRFVHREFLLGKPRSLAAARAARCAGEQGKFWEYHRDLLVRPGDMGDEDLQRRAQAMGLEGGKFGACVASDRFDAAINRASESGTELGIAATPTFFINGRRLVGVHPVGEFRELIDSELRKSS